MTTLISTLATIDARPRTVAPPRLAHRWRHPPARALLGLSLLATLVAAALLGPMVVGDSSPGSLSDRLHPPFLAGGSLDHPLGTDNLGRDLLHRIVLAARASLVIAATATALAGTIGVTVGLAGGFGSGWVDVAVTWLMDTQQALPFVVIAIGLVAVRGQTVGNVIAVLTLTGWVSYARVVRLATASLRRAAFVDAARVGGASTARILARHILPNVAPSVVVLATQLAGAMLVYEAGLTFLGLGVPSGTLTWGGLVADGRQLLLPAWWVSTLPGIALVTAVLGLSLFGDWLNDTLFRSSS